MSGFTHDELMSMLFVKLSNGDVVATRDGGRTSKLVFTEGSVGPEFYELLRSAPILYQAVQSSIYALELLERAAEEYGAPMLAPMLLARAADHKLALMVAREGLEFVAGQMEKNKKST